MVNHIEPISRAGIAAGILVTLITSFSLAQVQTDICPQGELQIEVDTQTNHLYLKCEETILMDAVCSTGSGRGMTIGNRTWGFETPKGQFMIKSIVRDPVWRRPDWAFQEEGLSVPLSEEERHLEGALGEFALSIGNGYFIHGTLFERLLGQSVTHGCIRLGGEDLEFLAQSVSIGTPVVIY
jgi:L,D-transpeptidase YbiS